MVSILLGSCAKNLQNPEAVKKAVLQYLSKKEGSGLNLAAMELDVSAVSYRENEADATIGFRAKGSAQAAMSMKYTLERKGDEWVVKATKDPQGGSAGHGMSGDAPTTDMPPNHPPIGDAPTKK